MKLKTYQAKSIADALAKVKKDLGRNAVILHTRTLSRGGVLGIGTRQMVEITATNDERVASFRKAAAGEVSKDELPSPKPSPRLDTMFDESRPLASTPSLTGDRFDRLRGLGTPVTSATEIGRDLAEIRGMVHDLVHRARKEESANVPAELLDYYTHLLAQDVECELAGRIVRSVAEQSGASQSSIDISPDRQITKSLNDAMLAELRKAISELLPPASPILLSDDVRPTIVALVGPTGVGKTTTVAKLAANLKLRENKKVGLITIDSYRIAAVEQLRTYAQILNVPILSVQSPGDMGAAIQRMSDLDLVLVDTAGRSQKDAPRIGELHDFIRAANPHQTHLVLSLTAREKTIRETIERFRTVGARHLIFSKLDEAEGLGVMLNVLHDTEMQPSYLTTGQAVPDDIEIGSASRIARLICGEGSSGTEARLHSGTEARRHLGRETGLQARTGT